MKIAIPVVNGNLSLHFGHCQAFAIVDVDEQTRQITSTNSVAAPDHQPGLLPPWLAEQGVTLVIAGGMGSRAQQLFNQRGINVITGAPSASPQALVQAHLAGTLKTGANACDH